MPVPTGPFSGGWCACWPQTRGFASSSTSALAARGYLAISHLPRDMHGDELAETFNRLNRQVSEPVVLRTQAEATRFFDGLDLVEPGVVQLPQWRPDPGTEGAHQLPMWVGAARKP